MLFKTLRANASRQVLVTLAIGVLMPLPAAAQDAQAPVFTPASAWQVGAAQLSSVRGLNTVKMPCVLSNEFDNGFVVRFSGGGQKMLAMAVDFRQNVFKQGRKYDAMISIGDSYVKQVSATSFTPSTLIFNLRPLPDFYAAVQRGQTMEVDIEGNVMKFTLGKLTASLPALESCYAGDNTAPISPLQDTVQSAGNTQAAPVAPVQQEILANAAPQPILPPAVAAHPMPQSMDDILKQPAGNAPAAQGKMQVSQVTPRPQPQETPPSALAVSAPKISRAADTADDAKPADFMPMPGAANTAQNMPSSSVWDAKAGEDLKIVLSRWAERAGYDLQWQADQDGKVAQDIHLNGRFEDAVAQLLAENSAATGIGGHVQTADGGKKDLTASAAVQEAAPAPAARAAIPALHDDWTAPAGANIQTVLEQWASKAGVTVVWQAYMNIPVKNAVKVSGSFEQAVQSLLDQYNDDKGRPVGQLNTDPQTGVRSLIMSMDSAS